MAAIEAAVARTPDAVNPRDDIVGTCLNTGDDGSHCIAAQVLLDLGLVDESTLPARGSIGTVVDRLDLGSELDQGAWDLLVRAQQRFDFDSSDQLPWSESLASIVRRGRT